MDVLTNPFNLIVFISLILLIFLIAVPLIKMFRTTFVLAAGELRRVQKTTPNAQVGDFTLYYWKYLLVGKLAKAKIEDLLKTQKFVVFEFGRVVVEKRTSEN